MNVHAATAALLMLASIICAESGDSALSAYDSLTGGKIIRYNELEKRMKQLPPENPLFTMKRDTSLLKSLFVIRKAPLTFEDVVLRTGGTWNLETANGELIQKEYNLRKIDAGFLGLSDSEKIGFRSIQAAMKVPEIGMDVSAIVLSGTVLIAGIGSLIYGIGDIWSSGGGEVDPKFLWRCATVGTISLTGTVLFGTQYAKKHTRLQSMIVQSGRRDFERYLQDRLIREQSSSH